MIVHTLATPLFKTALANDRISASCKTSSMGSTKSISNLKAWISEVQDQSVERSIEELKKLGFVCLDEKRDFASSRRCVGKIEGYPKKVAIYIPIHFDPNRQPSSLITHFHGHVVENEPFEKTLNRYHLGTELHESGRNSLLIVPESTGKCDTYRQELSSVRALEQFHARVLETLKKTGLIPPEAAPETITHEITGHSGAYWPIGNLLRESLDRNPPFRVGLFDATYCSSTGQADSAQTNSSTACRGIYDYATRHPGFVKSYFLENTQTAEGSRRLIPEGDRIPLSTKHFNHFTVMNENYSDWLKN